MARRSLQLASLALFLIAQTGCVSQTGDEEVAGSSEEELFWGPRFELTTDQPTTVDTPVGLAIEVENGVGAPLQVRAGQRFFINQIDLRDFVNTDVDNTGLEELRTSGDFASADWGGLQREENEPILLPNPDGTYTDRRFFTGAEWMERPGLVAAWQVDEDGHPLSHLILLSTGSDDRRRRVDGFFIRRFRAIQWVFDCGAPDDCSTATSFQEEAIVELRNANSTRQTFQMHPDAAGLKLWWSARGGAPYEIPVEQVASPEFDYGFDIEVAAQTPPGPSGYYEPGDDITFQMTLTDGSGNRLHPEGSLPSYSDVVFGVEDSGIQYYRAFAFIDPSATYWRRKHRERMLMAQIIGPNQDIQPIRTIAPLDIFLDEADTEVVGTPAVDGVYSEFTLLPPANVIFLGAFTPGTPQWFEPNVDTFTFHIPEDAEPGTYKVTVKGRRTYLGQDIPHTTTIEIQVGTLVETEPVLTTGPCNTCHSGGGDLSVVLHANDDRVACAGCHVPLGFELEGPIFVRTHFIHSRSDRFDSNLSECSTCHLSEESIQRTSKAACLSCHTEYPASHESWFGEIESIYIGGGAESFDQCTDSCHTEHPNAGFDGGWGP